MSVFNPQVQPTQDPNYLNYAKVVEAPAPDQSTGLAIKAATEGFDSLINITDTAIKKGIQDDATKAIDRRRDEMTAGLEAVKQNTANAPGVVPAPVQTAAGTTVNTGSLLDANASMDVPDGVDQGLDRITQLSEARKAAKINDTQYSMEVLSIAKRLRSQYGTGYRDYIDQEVSKISGLPVANSYYQNLIADINRQLVQVAGQKDKIEGLYLKNLDVPNVVQSFSQYKAGGLSEEGFIKKIADWQNIQTQLKLDAAARADRGEDRADRAELRADRGELRADRSEARSDRADVRAAGADARAARKDDKQFTIDDQTERMTDFVTKSVNFHLKDINSIAGMSSLSSLVQYFEDVSSGNIQATDAEVQQRKSQLAAYRNVIYRGLVDQTSGYAGVIGNDKAVNIIKNGLVPLDTFMELAGNKETGAAFFQARQLQAVTDQAKLDFLINKDTYTANKQIVGARNVLGEQYFPDWIRGIISNSKLDKSYQGLFEQEALSTVQPYEDKRGQPVPRYMKDVIQHGKSVDAPGEYHGRVVDLVSTLSDPKAPLDSKDKLIEWAFNPKNIGRLDELKIDYRDPNTGQMIPGKYAAFNKLSSPAVTQGVLETAKVKPENYQKYQSTLEQEFGKLFRVDVQNLNKVQEASKNPQLVDGKTLSPFLEVHYSWNGETNELGLVDKNNKPVIRDNSLLQYGKSVNIPEAGYISGAFDVIDRVNGGLRNLANIQKNNPQSKTDTSSYIFQTLRDVRGGEDILKAIVKSRNPDADVSKMNFAPDNRGPSVAQFVSNPTGEPLPKRPRGSTVGANETITNIQVDDIPEGMSAREFIQKLKKEGRY